MSVQTTTTYYPPHQRQLPHVHEDASVSLVLAGDVRECAHGHEHTAGPLELLVKGVGIRHENRYGPTGAHILRINFQTQDLDAEDPFPSWRWFGPGPATRAFVRVVRSDSRARESALSDLLAVLTPVPESHGPPPDWLVRVRESIQDEPRSRTSVAHLADAASVHPVHLARSFRRHFGTSVLAFQHQCMLRVAAEDIGTGASLAESAMEAGFSDQAHFTRVFGKHCGVTPGVYRRWIAEDVSNVQDGEGGET